MTLNITLLERLRTYWEKHPNTLRRWHKEGIIEAVVTPAGQRLYDISKFTTKRTKIKNSI